MVSLQRLLARIGYKVTPAKDSRGSATVIVVRDDEIEEPELKPVTVGGKLTETTRKVG